VTVTTSERDAATATVSLLIVDDHPVVLDGLRQVVSNAADIALVDAVTSAEHAKVVVERNQVDVVLVDVSLPGKSGIDLCRELGERHPEVRVLMLTSSSDDATVQQAFQAGARGFLIKDVPGRTIVEAIRAVARGEVHVDPRIVGYLVGRFREPAAPTTPVTDDELKLVRAIADGFSTVELAAHLCVSESTAKNYVSRLKTRLGVSNRAALIAEAARLGWLDPGR
jgi:DNA-binding NarL/FixJ family response regulator